MLVPNFTHRHAGHCESGVTASLLTHYGTPLSEPMALGLSGSLTFVHIPFIKVGGFPLTAYRMPPGSVYKGLKKALGLLMRRERFKDPELAMQALDAQLAAGHPVGLQTSVYWLPYFPPEMRFHFNAHNLIVYGKDGDDYLVSDPVFDQPQRCPSADLKKARFTTGIFAPKGLMYSPQSVKPALSRAELEVAVRRALKRTVNMMTRFPIRLVGVGAIRSLAKRIATLDAKNADVRWQRLYVGNIVRMQEEIGTGGGGFRFMYAAFLQEAGENLDSPLLLEASMAMTAAGDAWRQFALSCAHFARKREGVGLSLLAEKLRECARLEALAYEAMARF